MANKVLIALDSSERAWRAVEYVSRTFGHTPGMEVTLLHILADMPSALWDEGHILEGEELETQKQRVTKWQAEQEKIWKERVKRAREHLAAAGIPAESVISKIKPKISDVAEEIIEEATSGNYGTIIVGRRGLGTVKSLLLGSVTQKVVQYARGCAVTIVE